MTPTMPDAIKDGGFFQFPLCWLAQPLTFRDLLNRSFEFGVCHYLDKKELDESEPPWWPTPWRESAAGRKEALDHARAMIKFSGGNVDAFIRHHAEVAMVEAEWKGQGRKTCWVRLRNDIFFDTLNESALSERDFRALCAVFSAIGSAPFVEIGWQRIQWRAAGWLAPILHGAKPCGPLYPRGQIERSLGELQARNLFQCVTYRRGQRFWSHRLTREQLWLAVRAIKTTPSKRAAEAAGRRRLDHRQSAEVFAMKNPGTPAPHPAWASQPDRFHLASGRAAEFR